MAPSVAFAARIATCLLLGWVLLAVVDMAKAAGSATDAGTRITHGSWQETVVAEATHADRDDASCVKAPQSLQIHEPEIAKAESEPDLSLDSTCLPRCGLTTCVCRRLHDDAGVARRTTPLGRGPPRLA